MTVFELFWRLSCSKCHQNILWAVLWTIRLAPN